MFTRLALSILIVMFCLTSLDAQQVQLESTGRQKSKTMDDKLKVGDLAPDWELLGSDGKTYKLSNYKGVKGVVVAWYPAALTGG